MCVSLGDLTCYIDSYNKAYININTYFAGYQHEIKSDTDAPEWVLLPQADENVIKQSYIELNSKFFTKDETLHTFHIKLNDYGLYDDWISFLEGKLLELAEDFCKKNGIAYKI